MDENYSDSQDPSLITLTGPELAELPYEDAVSKLLDLYENTQWSDREQAADNTAQLADRLNKMHGVEYTVELNTNMKDLQASLLSNVVPEEDKLKAIEDWRYASKSALYNTDTPSSLLTAYAQEGIIDDMALQFRRGVVTKDSSNITDLLARGAETALAPLVGVSDLALGTDYLRDFRTSMQEHQKPEMDGTLLASLANIGGGVAGFAASALNPVTAWGYLGASIAQQGKDVYDTVLNDTGSDDAAKDALLKSTPGVLFGTFADKIVGGSLGALLKGEKGYLGAIPGLLTGAGGQAVQTVGTGEAMVSATGEEKFRPPLSQVLTETAAGGVIGGAVGALHSLKNARANAEARAEIEAAQPKPEGAPAEAKPIVEPVDPRLTVEEKPLTTEERVQEQMRQAALRDPENQHRITAGDDEFFAEFVRAPDDDSLDGPLADVSGDPLSMAAGADNTAAVTKILPVVSEGYSPTPVNVELAKTLGANVTNKDDAGSFGFVNPNAPVQLNVSRRIFASMDHARKTFAHELGHLIDLARRKIAGYRGISEFDPVVTRLASMADKFEEQIPAQRAEKEAQELSQIWRPGWDGKTMQDITSDMTIRQIKWIQYRSHPAEVMADAMSAIFNNPRYVQENFPTVWKAFETGINDVPELRAFWDDIVEINTNPQRLRTWLQERRNLSRQKEADIHTKAAEDYIREKREKFSVRKGLSDLHQRVVNRFAPAKETLRRLAKKEAPVAEQEAAARGQQRLRGPAAFDSMRRFRIDRPMRTQLDRYEKLGIPGEDKDPYSVLNELRMYQHVINDSTVTMDNIREAPALYVDAYNKMLEVVPEFSARLAQGEMDAADIGAPIDQTLDTLAKTRAYLTEKERAQTADALTRLPGKPEELGWVPYAVELLDDHAFNAERYIPRWMDYKTAQKGLAALEQHLESNVGTGTYNRLLEVNDQINNILMNPILEMAQESGVFPPKLLKRIQINKRSYSFTNVLKYYEKDPNIPAAIKEKIGTLSETGGELVGTIQRAVAILAHQTQQSAKNAAIDLAVAGNYGVRTVPYRGRSYLDEMNRLERKNPEKSYLIGKEAGRSTLYEIDSPQFKKMFESSRLEQITSTNFVLKALESFNKYFGEREFKTVFSPVFGMSELVRNVAQEATLAKSISPSGFLWFHTSPTLRAEKAARSQMAKALTKPYGDFSELPTEVQDLIRANALPFSLSEDMGGHNPALDDVENYVFGRMGQAIPYEGNMYQPNRVTKALNTSLERIGLGKVQTEKVLSPAYVNNLLHRAANKIGLGFVHKKIVQEEAATKLMGYHIGRNIRGLPKALAIEFANQHTGTPDPFGGGTEATAIGKVVLFGRAHVAGMNAQWELFKNDPRAMGLQYAYRKGFPRLLVSGAIMGPLVAAFAGEEQGEEVKKFLDKIPSFDKLSKNIIPVAWQDDRGNIRWSARAGEVNTDWKPIYLKLPYSREMVTIGALSEPGMRALEEYIETGAVPIKPILQNIKNAFNTVFTGNLAPAIQGARRTAAFLAGDNPQDYFRNRGIFPKDVAEAGSFVDRFYRYMAWSAANTYPGFFSLSPEKIASTDFSSPAELFALVPSAGRFLGMSNYGEYEKLLTLQTRKAALDARIRLNLGDDSQKLYNEYAKAQSYVSKIGKGWQEQTPAIQQRRIRAIQNWHSRAYRYAFNELRAAYEIGDQKAIDRVASQLERSSSEYLKLLEQE